MGNKVQFGVKNVHYATYTEADGVVTYGEPKPLPGAVELSVEPRGDMTEFYADDVLYYVASNNQGYDGTFTLANIPDVFAEDALGETRHETDLTLTESSNAKGQNFALLFEFDGDVKATRHVLYNCSASRPSMTGATKNSSTEPNTTELTFVSSPRVSDLKVKTKTTTETPDGIYNAWYDAVYESSEII